MTDAPLADAGPLADPGPPQDPGPWPILTAADPPPAYEREGRAALLIVCDHARNTIPQRLGTLGLRPDDLARHIAWDPGALEVATALAVALDAPLISAGYSRLVIDINRYPADPAACPALADGTPVPGNQAMGPAGRHRRTVEIHAPYHAAIAARLDRFAAAGVQPAFVSVHSFTPALASAAAPRPWGIALSYLPGDQRLSRPLLTALRSADLAQPVGDNEPYDLVLEEDFTTPQHAILRGLRHVQVEFRQDLIATPEDARAMAATFLGPLKTALAA